MSRFAKNTAVLVCSYFIVAIYAIADESEENSKYLYIKNIDTTLGGEKAGNFCGPLDEIIYGLEERTRKKWWRANDSFSMMFGGGVTQPSRNKIGMYPAKKPDSKDTNWYKIAIDDGVLIQGNAEAGLTDAAEHFIELLEGTGDDLRLPKGVFTPKDRKKEHHPAFANDPEGGKQLDDLWPFRETKSENEILQAVRGGLLTCQTSREEVLRWIGEKQIGHNPQSRAAINLMIEASQLSDADIYHAAVKYGLVRASWKTLRIQRALLAVAMKADDNGKVVEQIALGFRYSERDYKDFVKLLAPYEESRDNAVRIRAIQIRATLDKTLADLKKKVR